MKVGTLCAVDTKTRLDHLLPLGRYLELMPRHRRASDSDWVFAKLLTGNRITVGDRLSYYATKASNRPSLCG